MPDYDPAYVVTLVSVTFFALIFSVLTGAAAFLANLGLSIAPQWESPLTVMLNLATGLLPAVLFHMVSPSRVPRVRIAFYALSFAMAAARSLDGLGWLSIPFVDWIPAVLLAAAGALGLIFLAAPERRQRACYRFLLILTIATAAAAAIYQSPLTALAPDYLLVAFFCTILYYRERLIFFDVLIKRAAFFGFALAALIVFFLVYRIPDPLVLSLFLTPLFLVAPWADARLAKFIDRVFLGRYYERSDAERLFTSELQAAATEADLRSRAERALAAIFRSRAQITFGSPSPAPAENTMVVQLPIGWALVEARESGIPFMSDDRHLFESLAGTLAVVLENVRFREQQRLQHEREEQLRLLASRAELKVLRAQMNPHFLFNALNSIAGLIPSHPELADETIENLAQVFRYTLRRADHEWVRLDEEVEFVVAYLRVEQARFGKRLEVEVAVDPEAREVPVPAMCIQPLVENAVGHGISRLEQCGRIQLRVAAEGNSMKIEVCDNGPGFPDGFSVEQSSGHALRNIAERLRGYYGEAAGLGWNCAGPHTRVWLRMPCGVRVEAGERV